MVSVEESAFGSAFSVSSFGSIFSAIGSTFLAATVSSTFGSTFLASTIFSTFGSTFLAASVFSTVSAFGSAFFTSAAFLAFNLAFLSRSSCFFLSFSFLISCNLESKTFLPSIEPEAITLVNNFMQCIEYHFLELYNRHRLDYSLCQQPQLQEYQVFLASLKAIDSLRISIINIAAGFFLRSTIPFKTASSFFRFLSILTASFFNTPA